MNGLRLDSDVLGQSQPWVVSHRGLEHRGEVIVAESVDPDWGQPLERDLSFRIVFLTVPRRVPPEQIRDPRIAMAVPGRTPGPTRQTLDRELRAIRETRARYVTAEPGASALRASIEEREASLRGELARRDALAYSQGRVYTRPGITVQPAEVFVEEDASSWVNVLVDKVLSAAFPSLPFDHTTFPSPLTTARMASLYRGLFSGDPDAVDVARSYGPGLGLSRQEAPTTFDASNCVVVDIIRASLESRAGEMPAEEILRTLVMGHGLNHTLASLYLLAFVRQTRGEVGLNSGHSVRSVDGRPFPSNRISWDTAQQVAFTDALAGDLGEIRMRPEQTWNAVVPYAVMVVEDLQVTEESQEPEQERRLLEALHSMSQRLEASRAGVTALGASLGHSPQGSLDTIDRLQVLCAADGYRSFHSVAQASFDGPRGLRDALDLYARIEQLADLVPAITRVRQYLDEMVFGTQHRALQLERDALVGMAGLDNLIVNPSIWRSVEDAFQGFRRRYTNAYLAHHNSYHYEASELRHRLDQAHPQVEALARFNQVSELGGPFETEVPGRFADLVDVIRECSAGEEGPSLDEAPYCQACMLELSEEVPGREAEQLLRALEKGMRAYNRQLSSRAVREILTHPTREQLDKLISLAQVSDLTALANVLDDEVLEFLRRFMAPG